MGLTSSSELPFGSSTSHPDPRRILTRMLIPPFQGSSSGETLDQSTLVDSDGKSKNSPVKRSEMMDLRLATMSLRKRSQLLLVTNPLTKERAYFRISKRVNFSLNSPSTLMDKSPKTKNPPSTPPSQRQSPMTGKKRDPSVPELLTAIVNVLQSVKGRNQRSRKSCRRLHWSRTIL